MPFSRGDLVRIRAIVPDELRPDFCARVVRVFPPSHDRGPGGTPSVRTYMVKFDDGHLMQAPEFCLETEPVGRADEVPMHVIDLDAAPCTSILDFLALLRGAVGSPEWQGDSVDAFIDTMLFGGAALEPPYAIRVHGTSGLPAPLAAEIREFVDAIDQYIARQCGPDRDETLAVVS